MKTFVGSCGPYLDQEIQKDRHCRVGDTVGCRGPTEEIVMDFEDEKDHEDEKDQEQERWLRLPEVLRLVGLSKSTVYKMIKEGRFVKRRRNGARAVAFRLGDVYEWMKARAIVDDEGLQKKS